MPLFWLRNTGAISASIMRLLPAILILLACCSYAAAWKLGTPFPMLPRRSFAPHPKGCRAGTVYISVEEWLLAESGSATKPPAGKISTGLCAPHGQLLQRRQVPFSLTQTQGNVPANQKGVFQFWTVSITRDAGTGFHYPTAPGCSAGNLACKKLNSGAFRSSSQCAASGGKTIAPGTCQWADSSSMNIAGIQENGKAQANVVTQVVTKPTSGSTSRVVRLAAGFHVGVADTPVKPCVTTDWKADNGNCNMDNAAQHEVTAIANTDDILYTNVRVSPVYHLAVGGLWRLSFWAARLREPPGVPAGVPVSKHLVTIDPDFSKGNLGKILNSGPGYTTGTLVTANLKQLGISPGWHQLVVQGKATDPTTKLTQTAQVGFFFEVVPPCPKFNSSFMTHVLEDSAWQITNTRLGSVQLQSNFSMNPSLPPVWVLWLKRLNENPSYIQLSFDLSYLDPAAVINSASLVLHVSFIEYSLLKGARLPLVAYDASRTWRSVCGPDCPPQLPASTPCIAPVCSGAIVTGRGFMSGTQDFNRFVRIDLRPEWVTRHVAQRKVLKIAVTMPWTGSTEYGGVFFRSQNFTTGGAYSPPFLRLTASCA